MKTSPPTSGPLAISSEILGKVKGVSMLELDRFKILHYLCRATCHLPGAILEIGCYRGGTTKFLALIMPQKNIHAFDTFTGIPRHLCKEYETYFTEKDTFHDLCLKEVQEYLSDCPNTTLHPGVFPESLPADLETPCFIYFDGDLYQSCMDCLRVFWDKLPPGGVIAFDDYHRPECPGVASAINDFFIHRPESLVIIPQLNFAYCQKHRRRYR